MKPSESSAYPSSILNEGHSLLSSFNRYGLPGLVIGMLFLLNIGLMYTLLFTVIPALQGSTKAITEMSLVVRNLTETVKDYK